MDTENEVIAIFIDDGAVAPGSDELDFTATFCLRRDAGGVITISSPSSEEMHRCLSASGIFRPGEPIVDPVSGEVIGYELEEDESIRIAVG